jgi:choline-phosphate cytidylyltransferase
MRHVGFIEAAALYDSSAKRVEKFLRKFDVPSTHDNYAAFLAEDTAAVYIATDISDHYDHIKEALLAGKHVLCENPLVLQSRQAKELFALAKAKNLLLLMALKTAFAPAFNKMLEVLHSGEIGKVREVRATFTSLYGERGFPKRYIRNGATNLLMSYPSLIVHKVAGRSKTITFFDQYNGKYDTANRAVTTHKKGVVGIATVGIEMKSDGHAVIAGTKGYIYIPAPWWLTRTFSIHFEDPAKTHSFEYEFEGDGLRYMIAEFTSLIRQGKIESRRLTIDDMMELNRIIARYNKEKK